MKKRADLCSSTITRRAFGITKRAPITETTHTGIPHTLKSSIDYLPKQAAHLRPLSQKENKKQCGIQIRL
jgi:hypothetical protein